MNKRTYRMYGLVPYNLSPIQQGIQYGHALQEYNNLMMALSTEVTQDLRDAFDQWRKEDKTFIIYNGGTTNWIPERIGTLNQHLFNISDAGVLCASFREPDLGDQLTAFVFLADDRVFDRETWPDFAYDASLMEYQGEGISEPSYDNQYYRWKMQFADTEKEADKIVFLRNYLKPFRFA
jgi:hypothetical protein